MGSHRNYRSVPQFGRKNKATPRSHANHRLFLRSTFATWPFGNRDHLCNIKYESGKPGITPIRNANCWELYLIPVDMSS